jgi:hypothetical protein
LLVLGEKGRAGEQRDENGETKFHSILRQKKEIEVRTTGFRTAKDEKNMKIPRQTSKVLV